MISLPSVIYNGKAQLTELFHGHVVTDSVYEVFVADKDITYHGSYRCLKRAQMDWDILASFGQAVSTAVRNHEVQFLTECAQVRGIFLEPTRGRKRICRPSNCDFD